jgi:hypothetical protein
MMANKPSPAPEELILAMLRDVLARQAQQMGLTPSPPAPPAPAEMASPPASESPVASVLLEAAHSPAPAVPPQPADAQAPTPLATSDAPPTLPPTVGSEISSQLYPELEAEEEPLSPAEAQTLAEYNELAAQPVLPSTLPRTIRLLAAGLALLLILVNLPLFNGLALARALPDRQALVIRDGLLLKGSGPEVYVLQDNHKRWISSLDAFAHYGYKWDEVHIVDDAFLNQFPDGRPLHVLLKCADSPHIYRLENDRKRWIKDIPTFKAEGHVWEDVRFISCERLRAIPDGPPIPPDAGTPPQP